MGYDREPFGTKAFHAFMRVMRPLWDKLDDDHPGIDLFSYVVPAGLSPTQAIDEMTKRLGEDWIPDPGYSGKTTWGWSEGFRYGGYIVVFFTIDPKQAGVTSTESLVPAGILTDAMVIDPPQE
jgi:hypothetical protein